TGFPVSGAASRQSRNQQYMAWWYDEYAVNRTTGNASNLRSDTGWLGQALGPYYQMVWVGPGPDAVTNSGFETSITSGWGFSTSIGSVASADTNSAPEGTTSIRITVPVAVPAVARAHPLTPPGAPPTTGGAR